MDYFQTCIQNLSTRFYFLSSFRGIWLYHWSKLREAALNSFQLKAGEWEIPFVDARLLCEND